MVYSPSPQSTSYKSLKSYYHCVEDDLWPARWLLNSADHFICSQLLDHTLILSRIYPPSLDPWNTVSSSSIIPPNHIKLPSATQPSIRSSLFSLLTVTCSRLFIQSPRKLLGTHPRHKLPVKLLYLVGLLLLFGENQLCQAWPLPLLWVRTSHCILSFLLHLPPNRFSGERRVGPLMCSTGASLQHSYSLSPSFYALLSFFTLAILSSSPSSEYRGKLQKTYRQ